MSTWFAKPSAAAPPDPAALAASLFVTVGACFGTMFIGVLVARNSLLSADARRGVSLLYAKLVFPAMVFRGVAAIDLGAVDPSILGVMLLSKWALALCGLAFGALAGRGLAAGAMYAMAVSHSFDVSLGVPIARVLYPAELPYVYLNQSVQLVLVNPVLLVLMELGGGGGGAGVWRRALASTATNPLVVMTALGLAAALTLPAGLPPLVAATTKQVADAGPLLGFMSLGFAMAAVGGTSAAELRLCAALCGLKIVLMPALYRGAALALGVGSGAAPFLAFIGVLPASASVYSLASTKGLEPRVLGPLVPLTMLLCVALVLLPLSPAAAGVDTALSAAVAVVAAAALALTLRAPAKEKSI